jgi:hypothetical protein
MWVNLVDRVTDTDPIRSNRTGPDLIASQPPALRGYR